MRYAIISDIHSNLAAFQAVLEDMERRGGAGEIWCLGDIVGYGPDPGECIRLLRRYPHLCVAGNHDLAAIGKTDLSVFNPVAAAASRWTAGELSADDIEYLSGLPLTRNQGGFTLVHASPREPVWEYILSTRTARENFPYFNTGFCFVGHTHVPQVFDLDRKGICLSHQLPAELHLNGNEKRLIINCGGVGQPRDGDPRAGYAILDDVQGTLHHYRVEYDIPATQRKMIEAGLPSRLVNRLSHGL